MTAAKRSVKSVAEFVARVIELRNKWGDSKGPAYLWFRGVSKAAYDLKPGLYRLENPDEEEILIDFKLFGRQLVEAAAMPQDDWDWYFLMQHFRTPTRLLDWTDGALTALYFAVCRRFERKTKEAKRKTDDSAVWVLDPGWLNKQVFGKNYILLKDDKEVKYYLPLQRAGKKKGKPKFPVAMDPPHVARRVAVQRGHFTIHGSEQTGLEAVCKRSRRPRLRQIAIAGSKIEDIRKELETCGISEITVFPDLEGLGRDLTYKWTG